RSSNRIGLPPASPSVCFSPRVGFRRQRMVYIGEWLSSGAHGKATVPGEGFDSLWARCRANAWDGWFGGLTPGLVRRGPRIGPPNTSLSVAGGALSHELSPEVPRAGAAHQPQPYAPNQLRRPDPGPVGRPPAGR